MPLRSAHGGSLLPVLGVPAAIVYVAATTWASGHAPYEVWAALVYIPLLLLLSVPLLLRAGSRDPDPRFVKLLIAAFVHKAFATVARYLMAFVLYGGVADAAGYSGVGERLAASYREGDFSAEIGRDLIGTGFIRVVTGVIYAVTGPSIYVAYAVFSWLGFWGLYFFYRAFRVGVPGGDARRYGLLVLLLPSMLFWPSGLGKEAFMTLGLGLAAYGSVLLLVGDRRWVFPLLLGLTGTAMVRPHMTAAVFAALALAYVIRRNPRPNTELTPVTRLVAVICLIFAGLLVVNQAASFLGVEEISVSNVDAAVESTADRTNEGGSSFESQGVDSLLDFPIATISVLFRPFPFEAGNPQMLLAAAEGLLLIALILRSWSRLASLPGRLRRQPYLILCLAYAAFFVYAFSNFNNFGILTRERVMVLPFVLVLLALPERGRQPERRVRPPAVTALGGRLP